MRRTLWPLAALAMIALIVAGCGKGSAGTGNSTVTSGGNSTASTHEKAVKFAECMRANGVSAFGKPLQPAERRCEPARVLLALPAAPGRQPHWPPTTASRRRP